MKCLSSANHSLGGRIAFMILPVLGFPCNGGRVPFDFELLLVNDLLNDEVYPGTSIGSA